MRLAIAIFLLLMPVSLLAQGDGNVLSEKGVIAGILTYVVLLLGKFLTGIASKGEEWGKAWIDLRIAKLKQKRKGIQ